MAKGENDVKIPELFHGAEGGMFFSTLCVGDHHLETGVCC